MAEASGRAARPASRGGQRNLVFVVAAAEAPPAELHGVADEVRILFPWASLLRGVLGLDATVVGGIRRLLAPDALVTSLVSVAGRDRLTDVRSLDGRGLADVTARLAAHGFDITLARPATLEEVRGTRSTWGRRLVGGAADRLVWRLDMRRGRRAEPEPEGQPEVAAV